MFSFRTIAKISAAALAFIALSKINRHLKGESITESTDKATCRLEGIIRRRRPVEVDVTGDVI